MKKISAFIIVCSIGLGVQAQSIIDPLTGSLAGYTTTLVLDNSGGASSVSFTDSGSGLQANYVGTVSAAEQALFLAPVSSFSSVFTVGNTLFVNTAVPTSSTQMDFGLAVAATATPPAAGANTSTRANFDWASISVRPSQTAIRVNSSVSGTLTTGNGAINVTDTGNISELFINWVSADVFALGYVSNHVSVVDQTITFAPSSTIGAAIGFYGDVRASGTSLGDFTNLTIVPEPSTLALCGMGVAGLCAVARRKKQ